MPSRGNPNVPNKSRKVSSRRKIQKKNSKNQISKNPRGTAASSVLHPTSGPLAPISSKKARKLEKAANHARQRAVERAMEQEGEAVMTDAPIVMKKRDGKSEKSEGEWMDVDDIE